VLIHPQDEKAKEKGKKVTAKKNSQKIEVNVVNIEQSNFLLAGVDETLAIQRKYQNTQFIKNKDEDQIDGETDDQEANYAKM
jgi:hypothetical protein